MPKLEEAKQTTKQITKPEPFGYEMLLDLYDCKEGACDDLSLCYQFLDEIVTALAVGDPPITSEPLDQPV